MSADDPGVCRCRHERGVHVDGRAPGSTHCAMCSCIRYRPLRQRKGRKGQPVRGGKRWM